MKVCRRHNLVVGLAAAGAVLAIDAVVWVAQSAWHVMPLVLAAGLGVAGHRLGQRRKAQTPGHKATRTVIRGQVVADDLEVGRLRDENDQLRADLEDARRSAQLAWDAAAERPPRAAPARDTAVARLVSERMSGVRPLFPGGDR